ncbi:unnamed protein product, partial [marine sediment metagenome]
ATSSFGFLTSDAGSSLFLNILLYKFEIEELSFEEKFLKFSFRLLKNFILNKLFIILGGFVSKLLKQRKQKILTSNISIIRKTIIHFFKKYLP